MKPIIKIENVSKQYRLGLTGTGTFSHDVNRWWHTVRGKEDPYLKIGETNDRSTKGESDYVWALRDINFEVMPGEVLGIIGKNGAGKSTLLKLLSRVTAPTTGSIKARGRIASLLEVGTGFHPELTGGENVFLNGAIMGMTKSEIRSKFDEIVDFAGCERYIDTPVKRYSSGMYVRLAFAVAAHLEPEILVIDEVLAVGDSAFQQKCIEKMTEVSRSGRTILFVSHNMQAVRNLCERGIHIENGRIIKDGNIHEIIENYTSGQFEVEKEKDLESLTDRRGNGNLIFKTLRMEKAEIPFGERIVLELVLKTKNPSKFSNLDFGVAIKDGLNNNLIHVSNKYISAQADHENDQDRYVFAIENNLKPGKYGLVIFLRANEEIEDWIDEAGHFTVDEGNRYGYSNSKEISGLIQPEFQFFRRQAEL